MHYKYFVMSGIVNPEIIYHSLIFNGKTKPLKLS